MKATYLRVKNSITCKRLISGILPIVGSLLFFTGACFYYPLTSEFYKQLGAGGYTSGSIFFIISPLLGLYELHFNRKNLIDNVEDEDEDEHEHKFQSTPSLFRTYTTLHHSVSDDAHRLPLITTTKGVSLDYERLYKSLLLKKQANSMYTFAVGAFLFLCGSVLCFPIYADCNVHGTWLYIAGCTVGLIGSVNAAGTAYEMVRTAPKQLYPRKCWKLHWWTDEQATIWSCRATAVGNFAFIVTCTVGFPTIVHTFGMPGRWARYACSKIGALLFLAGALIDLLIIVRDRVEVYEKEIPDHDTITRDNHEKDVLET